MPTPTILWDVNANGDWATTADWNLGRLPNSTDNVAIDTARLHTVTHSTGTDTVHTLAVGNDNFIVSGGSLTINAASSFAQRLTVSGGTLKFGGAATVASFRQGGALANDNTVSGTGTLTVTGPATFAGPRLLQTGKGATVLQGASTLNGGNGNQFCLDGGRILENQGTFTTTASAVIVLGENPYGAALGGGTLKNDAGGIFDLEGEIFARAGATSFINAGTLETLGAGEAFIEYTKFTDTGVITIASGALEIGLFVTASIAGAISGAGTLIFSGGYQALNSGATVTVSHWSISPGAFDMDFTSINEALTYAGVFSQGAYTTLTVAAGDTLSLTGAATLGGNFYASYASTVNGAGTVKLWSATVAFVTIGGTATVSDAGTVDQMNGDVTIGDGTSNAATLSIGAGAAWRIDDDSGIARGASAASIIRNSGLLIKSGGTGTSVVGVKTVDTGAIEAASGVFDFTQAITGAGALGIDSGATLQVDGFAAATLGMTFNGGGATLALGDPASFKAAIHAFAATDTIDLLGRAATAATLGAGDTLVIKNGATTVATLQLAGSYSGNTFHVASDGHGGTNITVTTPAVAAQFISAMAGFGAGGGMGSARIGTHPEAFRPPLCAPRMHVA